MAQYNPYRENNPLFNLSFDFALAVISYCDKLRELRKYEMAGQLCRSGTAIHGLVREAQHPESRADFVHKLKIALKEWSETEGWLLMCHYSEGYADPSALLDKMPVLQKLLGKSIDTARRMDRTASKRSS